MNENEILSKLQEIFRDVFDEDNLEINLETNAEDIEDWDSLNHINIISASEREFKVKFALGELEGLQNVGSFISLITQKKA